MRMTNSIKGYKTKVYGKNYEIIGETVLEKFSEIEPVDKSIGVFNRNGSVAIPDGAFWQTQIDIENYCILVDWPY